MKRMTLIALALLAFAGCRQKDVREFAIDVPALTQESEAAVTGRIRGALAACTGVDMASLQFDAASHRVTLKYDSMQTAKKNIEMAECCRQSVEVLTTAMEKWRGDEDRAMWEDLTRIRKNENHVKRLYWQNLKEIESSESVRDVITSREFCRDLRALSKKIAKVADRIGDLVIKSIK